MKTSEGVRNPFGGDWRAADGLGARALELGERAQQIEGGLVQAHVQL